MELEEIAADIRARDRVDRGARRVHGPGDLDRLQREARVGLRVPPGPAGSDDHRGDDEQTAADQDDALDLNAALVAAQRGHVGRTEEALGGVVARRHQFTPRTSASAISCTSPAPMVMKMSFGSRRRRSSLTISALLRSRNSTPCAASAIIRTLIPSIGFSRTA